MRAGHAGVDISAVCLKPKCDWFIYVKATKILLILANDKAFLSAYEPASEGSMRMLSDELRGSLLMEPCSVDPTTFDAAAAAVSIAAAAASATAPAAPLTRLQPQLPRSAFGGCGQTMADIMAEDDARLSSMSPSPAPSSPALPMMTASSDEFVSDTRQPVTVSLYTSIYWLIKLRNL